MNRRLLALLLAAATVLPALAVFPTSTAQTSEDRVSFRPEVAYTAVKSETRLYLQLLTQLTAAGPTTQPVLWTYPPVKDDVGRSSQFAIVGEVTPGQVPQEARFELQDHLRHKITITGEQPASVHLFINAPPQIDFEIRLEDSTDGTQLATGSYRTAPGDNEIRVPLTLKKDAQDRFRQEVSAATGLRLVIRATTDQQGQALGTWTLFFGNDEAASSVSLITEDALKVAAWTEDEDRRPTTAFKLDRAVNAKNEIHGFFMMKSAFGHQDFDPYPGTGDVDAGRTGEFDIVRETKPRAELWRGGAQVSFTDVVGQRPSVDLVRDDEFSSATEGSVLFRFAPSDVIKYTNTTAKPAGQYELRVASQFRPDDPTRQSPTTVTARAIFAIANARVALAPWPGESSSHSIAPGRSSTFVFRAQNLGDVFDNMTLELTAIPSPQPGWGATLGGPALKSGGRVELPPGGEGIVTVTVTSPGSANPGDAATYQLRGRSSIDTNLATDPLPLLVSLVPEASTAAGAGVIVPTAATTIRVGTSGEAPVYIWNRGSKPTDLTMHLTAPSVNGWENVTLVYGGLARAPVTVQEVQPGALVQVGLRAASVLAADAEETYDATVNVTYSGLQDAPRGTVSFVSDGSAGFRLRMLAGFGGATIHTVEMERGSPIGNDPRNAGADKDALEGTWYRLWITNLGTDADTYSLEATSFVESGGGNDANFTGRVDQQITNQNWGDNSDSGADCGNSGLKQGCPPVLGFRSQSGVFTPIESGSVTVPAASTLELYAWVRRAADHDTTPLSAYSFNIQVESTGQGAGVQSIAGSAIANDACTAVQPSGGQATPGLEDTTPYACGSTGYEAVPGVEAVFRDRDYDTNHLVYVGEFEKRSITRGIDPGESFVYRIRVTNAASFASFRTANNVPISSATRIDLQHDRESAWRAVMRFAGEGNASERLDPKKDFGGMWREALILPNINPDPAAEPDTANLDERRWVSASPPGDGVGTRKQAFFDREVEVLVQPPNASSGRRVFAGENHDVRIQVANRHPVLGTQTDALVLKTVIGQKPRVELTAPLAPRPQDRVLDVAPGQTGIYGAFVLNNGSAPALVTFTAATNGTGSGVGVWTVSPTQMQFNLTPRENRTLAVRVTAPPNVPAGSEQRFVVTASWRERADLPDSPLHRATLDFTARVIPNDAITVTPSPPSVNAEPRQTVNFTIAVKNDGTTRANYRVDTILVPNWSANLAPRVLENVQPGQEARASFVMRVPGDVVSGGSNEFVIRVSEEDATRQRPEPNVAYSVVTVNLFGGQPLPSLSVTRARQVIERAGEVNFTFGVRNLGNTIGTFPLSVTEPGAVGWRAFVTDESGRAVTSLTIPANTRREVNLVVRAPVDVTERTEVKTEVFVQTADRTGGDRAEFTTVIHDYGLNVEAIPPRADMVPGLQSTFNLRVSNLGNDNDTFNLTLDMGVLADLWNYEYGQLEVRVPPNEFRDVRLTVRSPKDNLPTPRTVQMQAYAGSTGAANLSSVNPNAAQRFAKLDSTPLTLTVLDYRVGDVDQDNLLELAVDANKRKSDGFELFKEIYTTGTLSQAIESAQDVVTGHTRFLVDVPTGGSYDGIADVFWDPDASSVTRIQATADVNFDASPDYFLDVNADTLVDRVYDSGGRRYLTVEARDILGRGDLDRQYLVYNDADRFPDAFYDPQRDEVWKVIPAPSIGENIVGFIPKDKTRPTLYYDIAAQRVYQSPLVDSVEFFKEYWYAFVLFAGAVVVLGIAIARRRPLER